MRLPTLVALTLGVLAAIALIGLVGCATTATPRPTHRGRDGVVVGGIIPCSGLPLRGGPLFEAGTVSALKGRIRRLTIPNGATASFPNRVAGQEMVATNERYRFVLAPGSYVLRATFPGGNVHPFVTVTVRAGTVGHANVPNMCK